MALAFSLEANDQIDAILKRYPTRLAALIPVLFVAQRAFGHVSPDAMELVAARLDLPAAQVIATATFYTMFNKKPVGHYHVQVCRNISCYLRGADEVTSCIGDTLGVRPGGTTADGLFTLEEVECLAACGRAPIVQVNEQVHEWQTRESVLALIAELRELGPGSSRGGD